MSSMQLPYHAHITAFLRTDLYLEYDQYLEYHCSCERKAVPVHVRNDVELISCDWSYSSDLACESLLKLTQSK